MNLTERLEKNIAELQKMLPIVKPFDGGFEEYRPGALTNGVVLHISELSQLHTLRTTLRETFGKWEDKIGSIWYSHGAMAEWKGLHAPVVIWLRTSIENFPKQLKKKGCDFVETSDSKDYAFVCDMEG